MPEACRLSSLYDAWMATTDEAEQARIWREMLMNHAENLWSIGTVAGALQPVVAKDGLRNIPAKAIYSWEPTSMLGVYRIDEFFWGKPTGREAAVPTDAIEATGSLGSEASAR
jgi:peptide/nickel transport system substrate-binding protein